MKLKGNGAQKDIVVRLHPNFRPRDFSYELEGPGMPADTRRGRHPLRLIPKRQ